MLDLFIGNRNYSSWSMRIGVLLRAFDISYKETLLPFGTDGIGEGSRFKEQSLAISPTGTVPILRDSGCLTASGEALVLYDTLSIVEYVAERFPDQSIWPRDQALRAMARNLCAEMHSGFGALRSHCPMNIGADLHREGAIIWRDQPNVRRDVVRLDTAWENARTLSRGPFLCGKDFGAVDAYFAPVVMRLKYYSLPVSDGCRAYMDQICNVPAVQDWIASAIKEAEFLEFEEPFRLAP